MTHNPVNGKSLQELRTNTDNITAYLTQCANVSVIEMWECEWEEIKAQNAELRAFLRTRFPRADSPLNKKRPIDSETIVEAVKSDKLFGIVQCDLEVPEDLRTHFEEMQPIFKNTMIERKDLGDFMQEYAEEHGLLSQPRQTLVGSFFGKNILLITPLLRWYLSHGLKVTNVQQVIEYRPLACFRGFGETVSRARREGDSDPSKAILADTFKLLGNSAYGKTITNIAKHTNVYYVSPDEAKRFVNQPLFKKLTPLADDIEEVEMGKSLLRWNLPNQIGFYVYQYAKLRMLQFHFDFIDRFVHRQDYQLCEMDTDSLYMVLSKEWLKSVIRPELKEEFYREYPLWFPALSCDEHHPDFVRDKLAGEAWKPSEPCCLARSKFDKRTPGLFKLEYKGRGIVALCSKTYYCFGDEGDKRSSKGLSKTQNDLTKDSYLKVLASQEPGGGVNRSFRTDGAAVYTYEQKRRSLSFFYPKRRVQRDGVSTAPLLI